MPKSITDYKSPGDSISMAKIADEPFTIVGLEKSSYEGSPSYYITTKETWTGEKEIDGKVVKVSTNKLHTTRQVIVEQLDKIKPDLDKGETFNKMKAVQRAPKNPGKKGYWELTDA